MGTEPCLPTRASIGTLKRAERDAEKADERHARELLFLVGQGRMTKLPRIERTFVRDVAARRYDKYVQRCHLKGKTPVVYKTYFRKWYGNAKQLYIHNDVWYQMQKQFGVVGRNPRWANRDAACKRYYERLASGRTPALR